jgi:hypothetical protein
VPSGGRLSQIIAIELWDFDSWHALATHYPNGRVMTDDVFSTRMIFMVHGHATPQTITPHDDLTTTFPYLGPPHP